MEVPILSLMYLFRNTDLFMCVYLSIVTFLQHQTYFFTGFLPLAFNLLHHYRSFTCLIKFILMLEYFLCVHSSTIMFSFSFVEIQLIFLLTL